MMAIAGEANQIFRPTSMFDHGIDGEVEFKDNDGNFPRTLRGASRWVASSVRSSLHHRLISTVPPGRSGYHVSSASLLPED